MGRIDLTELPPELAEHLPPGARLTFPRQGMTSEVAFAGRADGDGRRTATDGERGDDGRW